MKLPSTIKGCHELILKQQVLIEQLIVRVSVLEEQSKKTSKNSNKPPSSDGLKKQPAFPRKKGKKRGGQIGHKGRKLDFTSHPDETKQLYCERCTCGHGLDKTKALLAEIRQEFDIPAPKLYVTEYQKMAISCTCCGKINYGTFPEHIKASTQYGAGVKSLTVLLNSGFALPIKKVKMLFTELFGYAINESTIINNTILCSKKLEPIEELIKTKLQSSKVGHSDETGVRVAGKLHWLHVFSNLFFTYLFVHPKRGKDALNDSVSILPTYSGWVVHDCWSSYFNFKGIKHALCGAHILRELYALNENGTIWAKWFDRYFRTLLHLTKQNNGILTEKQQDKALELFKKICNHANKIEPLPERISGKRGKPKATKARTTLMRLDRVNLLNRLIKHQDAVLAFAFHEEVPFTNNLAERDLRPIKTKQKVAGSFRTIEGAQRHARIYGFISSIRKNQLNIFKELNNIFNNTHSVFQ